MRYKVAIMALSVVLAFSGCYGASHLRTSYLGDTAAIQGTFDIVYYGARYADDPDSMVVLDVSGDKYSFVPFAVKGSYRTEQGVSADDALLKATKFLKQNKYYNGTVYDTIFDPGGTVIGYQIIPQYEQLTYVKRPRVNVNYYIENDSTVRFYVQQPLQRGHDLRTPQ